MSPIDENHLHSDPGIEARHHVLGPDGAVANGSHGARGGLGATPLQSEPARTIFQKGAPGRRAFVAPALDVPEVDVRELLPERLRRTQPPRLPEVSEPEI